MTTGQRLHNASFPWGAHVAILLANMGWGIMSPVSKDILLGGLISPLALSGIRILGGAFFFLLFSFLLPASAEPRQKVRRCDWWRIAVCSLLMISANQGLFILGLGYTNPVDSSVMSSLTPLFTMILAAIFLHFPMTWMKILGVVTGLAGVVALVAGSAAGATATNPLLGNMLCLTAQLCAAIYYVAFEKTIRHYSAYTLMKWMFVISAFTYVPVCIPEMLKTDYASLPATVWLELTYIILFGTFLSYLMIPVAQKRLRPTQVSMYNYLQPVFAAITAILLGVGSFGWGKAAATALIFIGIALVNRSSARR